MRRILPVALMAAGRRWNACDIAYIYPDMPDKETPDGTLDEEHNGGGDGLHRGDLVGGPGSAGQCCGGGGV
jgi:hypothetical protein